MGEGTHEADMRDRTDQPGGDHQRQDRGLGCLPAWDDERRQDDRADRRGVELRGGRIVRAGQPARQEEIGGVQNGCRDGEEDRRIGAVRTRSHDEKNAQKPEKNGAGAVDADALAQVDRTGEAKQWFEKVAKTDSDNLTDAGERLKELN